MKNTHFSREARLIFLNGPTSGPESRQYIEVPQEGKVSPRVAADQTIKHYHQEIAKMITRLDGMQGRNTARDTQYKEKVATYFNGLKARFNNIDQRGAMIQREYEKLFRETEQVIANLEKVVNTDSDTSYEKRMHTYWSEVLHKEGEIVSGRSYSNGNLVSDGHHFIDVPEDWRVSFPAGSYTIEDAKGVGAEQAEGEGMSRALDISMGRKRIYFRASEGAPPANISIQDTYSGTAISVVGTKLVGNQIHFQLKKAEVVKKKDSVPEPKSETRLEPNVTSGRSTNREPAAPNVAPATAPEQVTPFIPPALSLSRNRPDAIPPKGNASIESAPNSRKNSAGAGFSASIDASAPTSSTESTKEPQPSVGEYRSKNTAPSAAPVSEPDMPAKASAPNRTPRTARPGEEPTVTTTVPRKNPNGGRSPNTGGLDAQTDYKQQPEKEEPKKTPEDFRKEMDGAKSAIGEYEKRLKEDPTDPGGNKGKLEDELNRFNKNAENLKNADPKVDLDTLQAEIDDVNARAQNALKNSAGGASAEKSAEAQVPESQSTYSTVDNLAAQEHAMTIEEPQVAPSQRSNQRAEEQPQFKPVTRNIPRTQQSPAIEKEAPASAESTQAQTQSPSQTPSEQTSEGTLDFSGIQSAVNKANEAIDKDPANASKNLSVRVDRLTDSTINKLKQFKGDSLVIHNESGFMTKQNRKSLDAAAPKHKVTVTGMDKATGPKDLDHQPYNQPERVAQKPKSEPAKTAEAPAKTEAGGQSIERTSSYPNAALSEDQKAILATLGFENKGEAWIYNFTFGSDIEIGKLPNGTYQYREIADGIPKAWRAPGLPGFMPLSKELFPLKRGKVYEFEKQLRKWNQPR